MFDSINRFILMTTLRLRSHPARTRNQDGATAIEYGLLLTLIAGVIMGIVGTLGEELQTIFEDMTWP